ncbi:flagellar basal body L-ring protein FlgH [Cupriavidus sp.]|uniref:flagellar basal body L-ring protein FlgH n=2 Tax=Cupriavidus sp. TaxID=1873897 RepID=UPI0025BD4F3C|nr:flagellar basal body L-ring protein FlgH [Cupriavidus sp.]MCA3184155.1 flagellar basal body L-ring protein FlgH [Cupriavidus sp.]MCA3191798.1 flagellar basal body L-ring protein FlgH [Cupriavidus sp.]MCA3198028.1 flagellar basal body L-ring protein FlgH [Cupriavidus sp.]MCA3200712.1 flagellar basal body L-ring protein FlgH [Cupriavidus sp.]MCA3236546.1 flagellar basal body L-ring protein FlgH [Cupriavidus sp.]
MTMAATQYRIRAIALHVIVGLAALANGGCAMMPKEPLVQMPTTARAEPRAMAPATGSIYASSYAGNPLFEDRRPRNVGDILTIVISENVNASKNSATNANRTGSTALAFNAVPRALGGLFGTSQNADINGANSLKAGGGASAANTFNGTITVTVIEVLPNSNLVVSGEKQMAINQGAEFIRFSGVVNPRTITGDNAVPSTQVADARIEYTAKGYIDEAQNMGWLQRFFLNVLPY